VHCRIVFIFDKLAALYSERFWVPVLVIQSDLGLNLTGHPLHVQKFRICGASLLPTQVRTSFKWLPGVLLDHKEIFMYFTLIRW